VTRSRFLIGFLLVALVIAGGLSYLASSDPDGLDSVTLHGCTVTETAGGEQLDGTCIAQSVRAQNAGEHQLGNGPLADYALGGRDGTTGFAGVVGVLVTALVAGSVFWALSRTRGPGARSGGG
jgi:cobalt/nickel transport protein